MKNNLITILLIIFILFTFAGIKRNYICIDKETPDWTGTTQGEAREDSIGNIHLHKCIRISERAQREMDSIDDYMRHWYEVLDTNSDGDIDDTE
jgi:hypothetical protein